MQSKLARRIHGLAAAAILTIFAACAPKADFEIPPQEKIALKNPIVLVHGASMGGAWLRVGPIHLGSYWQLIPEYLEANGNKVAIPHLTTDSAIAERAMLLNNFLTEKFPGKKVNIIAHSLGGLDSRFLVSVLRSKQVASITSIATPNRGSPLADWAWDQTQNRKFWYWVLRAFGYNLAQRHFLSELRTQYMEEQFNKKVRDIPEVKYYSVKTWGEIWRWSLSPLLYIPNWFVRSQNHAMAKDRNDGLVPLSSQEWGSVIAELPLDHLAQINHHTLRPWNGEASIEMYHMILKRLAADGF